MPSAEPFIPNDKPRSWVITVCAGLMGLAVGFVAFLAAWLGLSALKAVAVTAFVLCWVVLAAFGLVFLAGLLTGRYSKVESRPWKEQVW